MDKATFAASGRTPRIILKRGRERAVLNQHPWVFSGAIAEHKQAQDGDLVFVCAHDGSIVGSGYFNSRCSLALRMLSCGTTEPLEVLSQNVSNAISARAAMVPAETDAYRVINAEGDKLPGLIVDRYGDVLVLQVGSLGIEKLKDRIVSQLVESFSPRSVCERSNSNSRTLEGLSPAEGVLFGEDPGVIDVREHGLLFRVDVREGQKTGFFLDQREMRARVGSMSQGKSVLNCFGYTGGFSVYAAKGGATCVSTVDISEGAIEGARENFLLNGLKLEAHKFHVADVFSFLRDDTAQYDLVILDPPAFAKKQNQVSQAARGYGDLNRLGFSRVAPGGVLVTCSCSHFVDEKLFRQVVFQSGAHSGRSVQIIGAHQLATDHPVSLFHPEGSYLKSLILRVA